MLLSNAKLDSPIWRTVIREMSYQCDPDECSFKYLWENIERFVADYFTRKLVVYEEVELITIVFSSQEEITIKSTIYMYIYCISFVYGYGYFSRVDTPFKWLLHEPTIAYHLWLPTDPIIARHKRVLHFYMSSCNELKHKACPQRPINLGRWRGTVTT